MALLRAAGRAPRRFAVRGACRIDVAGALEQVGAHREQPVVERITVESNGPLHAILRLEGSFTPHNDLIIQLIILRNRRDI